MKNVGIFGGTFNPIHNGHIAIAEAVYREFNLDFVVFMPNGYPSYKEPPQISDKDREEMVKLAISDFSYFRYSDFEISKKETTYTSVTLPGIRKEHPDWNIFYIVGSDSLCNMDKWYNPDIIFDNAVIISALRDTEEIEEVKKYADYLQKKYHGIIKLIYNDTFPISSSQIRKAVRNDIPINDMVPKSVLQYILDKGLYHGI